MMSSTDGERLARIESGVEHLTKIVEDGLTGLKDQTKDHEVRLRDIEQGKEPMRCHEHSRKIALVDQTVSQKMAKVDREISRLDRTGYKILMALGTAAAAGAGTSKLLTLFGGP